MAPSTRVFVGEILGDKSLDQGSRKLPIVNCSGNSAFVRVSQAVIPLDKTGNARTHMPIAISDIARIVASENQARFRRAIQMCAYANPCFA